jgi:diacylglycerol kinase family enzyme
MAAFIILNPKSGGGRVAEFDLDGRARAAGAQTHVLEPGDDLAAIASKAADDGAAVLGIAGGDGSLAVVARVAMERDLPFLCLPAGTLNHFARDAGLDIEDPPDALRALTDGREKRIDVGELNDSHTFLNVVSLGVYAAMVADPTYRYAKGRVARGHLEAALAGALHPRLDVCLPDGSVLRDALVLLISNNPFQFARMRWNAERFRLDRGVLGLAAIALPPGEYRRRRDALAQIVLRGRDRSEFWREWTAVEWEQDFGAADEPIPVALDGESLILDGPVRVRIRSRALRLLVPRDVPDERSRRSRVASPHSVTYAWRLWRRWIRVTHSGR